MGSPAKEQFSVLHFHIAGRLDTPSGNIVPNIKKMSNFKQLVAPKVE